jgi:diguanylate cyclase (GGDEF)-like protein
MVYLNAAVSQTGEAIWAGVAGASAGHRVDGWVIVAVLLAFLLGGLLTYALGLETRRRVIRLSRDMAARQEEQRRQGEHLANVLRERDALLAQMDEREREFARLASEDALTGLPNGRAFDEQLALSFSRSKRHGQPLSLVLLDIDHLKQVNDNWSHAAGDYVLKEAARLLRTVCRMSDLPARLGGDTFAVILTDTGPEGGRRLCERLQTAFASHTHWHEGEMGPNYVTFSAGLVSVGPDDTAPVHLVQRAERALYLARHAGGARTSLG